MFVVVLRPIPAGVETLSPGLVADGGAWANLHALLAGEYVRPLTSEEFDAYAEAEAQRLAAEAEAVRLAAEAEDQHLAQEAEAAEPEPDSAPVRNLEPTPAPAQTPKRKR